MRASFLDGVSLANKLHYLFSSCSQLDIAMAYVKIGGLRTLLKNADDFTKRDSPMRIVIGLSSRQGITDKESAEELLRLSHRKTVIVKKWNNPGFHPKLLIFHGNHPSVVVGSSNLTEAAQSTNAEANVLVEDADPQFMREAEEFFERYFNPAPILERKHVNAYAPKSYDSSERSYSSSSKEDELPPPPAKKRGLEVLKPNKIWKIAPGKDAYYWPEWLKTIDDDGEGIVAIGWDEIGSLKNFKSYDSLRQAVSQAAANTWDPVSDRPTDVEYVTKQLWMFKTAILPKDVIIVYSESRVLGIAEVSSESKYQFRRYGENEIRYGHQINVTYLWYKDWPKRADDDIVATLGKQGTLRLVKENWIWRHILETLP
jgi:HKD family nuclease